MFGEFDPRLRGNRHFTALTEGLPRAVVARIGGRAGNQRPGPAEKRPGGPEATPAKKRRARIGWRSFLAGLVDSIERPTI